MKVLPLLLVLSPLLAAAVSGAEVKKIECFADLDGDKNDPNNIYTCRSPETCCQEKGLPSCCTEKTADAAALDQAKLWGMVILLILVVGALMWYCRHDGNCSKCCSCCKRKNIDEDNFDNTHNPDIEEVKMPPPAKVQPVYGDD